MDCNVEIYLMDTNGNNVARVTTSNAIDGFPDWSPDGTRLVLHSYEDGRQSPILDESSDFPWGFDIYAINVDATDRTRITDAETSDSNPSRSPDGEWIVFSSDRNIYSEDHDTEMLQNQLYICDNNGDQIAILETGIVDSNWTDWEK